MKPLHCAFKNSSTNDLGRKEMPLKCQLWKCSGVLTEPPRDERKHCFFEYSPRTLVEAFGALRNMSAREAVRISEAQL